MLYLNKGPGTALWNFYTDGNALCEHWPGVILATCGCRALEFWLVGLRKLTYLILKLKLILFNTYKFIFIASGCYIGQWSTRE